MPTFLLCRLENAIVTYCIVAWRVLHFAYVADDAPCTLVFSDAEWKGLYLAIYRRAFAAGKDMLAAPPSLSTAAIWLGRLGGSQARKNDGMPGVKVLWRGFQRLDIFTRCLQREDPKRAMAKGKAWENAQGYVFTTQTGAFLSEDNVSRDFSRTLKRAALAHRHLHNPRDTNASMGLEAEVPLEIKSKQLGHTNFAFTVNRYGDLLKGANRGTCQARSGRQVN